MNKEEFDEWMKIYEEVKAEAPQQTRAEHTRYSRSADIIDQIAQMNPTAIFLGADSEYGPVTVDIVENRLGPIMISTGNKEDDRDLVKSIIQGIESTQEPDEVRYGILTPDKNKWPNYKSSNFIRTFIYAENASEDFILSLASWAHSNKSRQNIYIFLEDLKKAMDLDFDARQNLRWLLLRGPARGVFPIVSIDPKDFNEIGPWMDVFETRITKLQNNKFRLSIKDQNLDFFKTI